MKRTPVDLEFGRFVSDGKRFPSGWTARGVVDQLGDRLPPSTLVVDGGPCVGSPSTVVDVTGAEPVVLRAGAIDLSVG